MRPVLEQRRAFARGAVVGTFAGGTWTFKPVAFPADFPNRYLQGAAIDPKNENHLIVGVNGFSRRFTEAREQGSATSSSRRTPA